RITKRVAVDQGQRFVAVTVAVVAGAVAGEREGRAGRSGGEAGDEDLSFHLCRFLWFVLPPPVEAERQAIRQVAREGCTHFKRAMRTSPCVCRWPAFPSSQSSASRAVIFALHNDDPSPGGSVQA